MPSMSNRYFAYIAPVVESEADVRICLNSLSRSVAEFEDQCLHVGLTKRAHYSLKPLSHQEIRDILNDESHRFPRRFPICEINFRSRKCFELFRSSGIADEIAEPI
jgi:hypothetical protein